MTVIFYKFFKETLFKANKNDLMLKSFFHHFKLHKSVIVKNSKIVVNFIKCSKINLIL